MKPIRNKKHLARIAEKACCCCGQMPVQVHHLLRGGNRGMGMRNGDDMTIPLCFRHHTELHAAGNETAFLGMFGINGPKLAAQHWRETNA